MSDKNSESSIKLVGGSDRAEFDNEVEYLGSGVNSCGYCKADGSSNEGRRSYDMRAHKLTADVYQNLMDRCWRRSGNYCYQPINSKTCCPNYPITCKATKFKLGRSQRQCISRLNSFLIYGTIEHTLKLSHSESHKPDDRGMDLDTADIERIFSKLSHSSKARDRRFVKSCERKMQLHGVSLNEAIKMIKMKARNNRADSFQLTLEDHLYPKKTMIDVDTQVDLNHPKHRLQIRMLHVISEANEAMRPKEHEILLKYQEAIHKEGPEDWTLPRYKNFLVKTPLKTELIKDRDYCLNATSDEPGSNLSFDVYSGQNDEYALVKPPELPIAYGTYHCVYLLDDELIAVGVLDILTKCVTTVYFFYDPKYSFLNLGTYSALVEISIVRQMARHYIGPPEMNPLIHYYLGFYVHECKKMRYKVTFKPSYLLCSETHRYIPSAICLDKLKDRKYARFDTESIQNFDICPRPPEANISKIPISVDVIEDTNLLSYTDWLWDNLDQECIQILLEKFLIPYARLIGSELLPRILVQLNTLHRALVERHQNSFIIASESSKTRSKKPT